MSEFEKAVRAWWNDTSSKNYKKMILLVPKRAKGEIEKAAKQFSTRGYTSKHEQAFEKLKNLLGEYNA